MVPPPGTVGKNMMEVGRREEGKVRRGPARVWGSDYAFFIKHVTGDW